MHGDTVATVTGSATEPSAYYISDEYGNAEGTGTQATRYGWLGAKQRSHDDLAGLYLMGVRLYNPATGTFTSADPVYGGNANTYMYPADPVNSSDLSGATECNEEECRGMLGESGGFSETTRRGGRAPNLTGQAGEAAVRAEYDIGPKVRIRINGRTRIPDGLTKYFLNEVKNRAHVGWTRQIRDEYEYANKTGRIFVLYVRRGATLSHTLENEWNHGYMIVRRFDP